MKAVVRTVSKRWGYSLSDIQEAIDRFISDLRWADRSPYTIMEYGRDLAALSILLSKNGRQSLTEVTVDDLKEYLDLFEGLKPATKNRHKAAVQSFFRWAVKNQKIAATANPAAGLMTVAMPKNRLPVFLEIDEVSLILRSILDSQVDTPKDDFIKWRDLLLIAVMTHMGLRVSEAVSLTVEVWEQAMIAYKNLAVTGKGKKDRSVPIHEELGDLMAGYFQRRRAVDAVNPHLFPAWRHRKSIGKDASHLSIQSAERIVKARIRDAGIPNWERITPHKLRHTFATQQLLNGTEIAVIGELMGHESLNTTRIYTHITKEKLKEAIKKQPGYL